MPRLSYAHRLRLAWELTWPLAVIDAAAAVVIHAVLRVEGPALDSLWAVAVFFGVSPWVIRRAFRRAYGGSVIGVERAAPSPGGPLRYQESLKVMWLLAWRTLVLALGAILAFSFLLRLAGVSALSFSVESPVVNALGLNAVDSLATLLFAPLLIPSMLRKRYRGFRLCLSAAPVPPRRKKTPTAR
jgi:hypothetical protein